jgi:hypothetical protein
LPLFTSDGGPIENKSYDIKLYAGTPFDKEVFSADSQKQGNTVSHKANISAKLIFFRLSG